MTETNPTATPDVATIWKRIATQPAVGALLQMQATLAHEAGHVVARWQRELGLYGVTIDLTTATGETHGSGARMLG